MIKDKNKPVAIWPGLEEGVPKPVMPYSPAVKVGDWLFIAGQLASDFKTGVPSDLIPKNGDPSQPPCDNRRCCQRDSISSLRKRILLNRAGHPRRWRSVHLRIALLYD